MFLISPFIRFWAHEGGLPASRGDCGPLQVTGHWAAGASQLSASWTFPLMSALERLQAPQFVTAAASGWRVWRVGVRLRFRFHQVHLSLILILKRKTTRKQPLPVPWH